MPKNQEYVPLVDPADWMGRKVRDMVSGFAGFCTGRHEYMNGCIRFTIDGMDSNGKPDAYVFDMQQLAWADEWIAGYEPKQAAKAAPVRRAGGPRDKTPPGR